MKYIINDTRFNNFKKKQYNCNNRFIILFCIIIFSISIIVLKITMLQLFKTKQLIKASNSRSSRIQIEPNSRGTIQDRSGYLLAVSIPVNNICIDPKLFFFKKKIAIDLIKLNALSQTLSVPLKKIIFKLNHAKNSHFAYLARKVSPEIGEYIKKLHVPGVYISEDFQRYYPFGKLISQLIGITNIDGVGIEGLEKSFNKILSGTPGKRKIRTDKFGNIVEHTTLIKKQLPRNINLSIDMRLQAIIYHELSHAVNFNKAKSGTAILTNVKTGEILAMVNSPTYNPNNLKHISMELIRNKAVTDMFEPGSTVKPMVIMKALQKKIITPKSIIDTTPFMINKHIIRDVSYHKQLSITDILKKSSNTGVSKLALSMPASELTDIYSKFGLGKPTNLGLIGERKGIYPTRKHWSNLDKATFSFGYGLMVTPLQLSNVYTIIGRYGLSTPLSIIKNTKIANSIQVFPKSLVKTVLNMLESVTQPGGIGIKAAIKGYKVAVKTGTAKKINSHGKYINRYVSYAVGVAPVSNPQFSLIVMINDPKSGKYYGGIISAPVFSSIMRFALKIVNIKPDNLSIYKKHKILSK
ncbi:MAG: penicillin-binding transpeptidase domain-containing protein [Buchnera aphidicola (Schlechtendalia peitan)]